MKKQIKANSIGNGFLNKILVLLFSLCISNQSFAQCLVSSYPITTGLSQAIAPTLLLPGNADPFWQVIQRDVVWGAPLTVPIQAKVVTKNPNWVSGSGSRWICDLQSNANPGINKLGPGHDMTFRRSFRLCEGGEVTFNMSIMVDNEVTSMLIDGIPVTGWSNPAGVTGYTTVTPFTQFLTTGTHTIDFVVTQHNYQPQWPDNAVGLSLIGTISASNSIIVNDFDISCVDLDCGCEQSCYWRLMGNNVTSANHFIGTTNLMSLKFRTNNIQRGLFDGDGNFGINLGATGTPTAKLHVQCFQGSLMLGPSNIRFENLQQGNGSMLVIDDDGYVKRAMDGYAGMTAGNQNNEEYLQMKNEISNLKSQLAELKGSITTITKSDVITPASGNELYQNNPNPFGAETSIGFNIVKMQESAFIAIYDLNGRELYRYAVTAKGKGNVTVSGEKLVPGQYLYSLIVDGREEATKKMVVSK